MKAGIKENARYKDIDWLMPSVDIETVFEKLGIEIERWSGDEVTAFCPDHHIFTGRRPSHSKWTLNSQNGKTFCFTEGRGSNLVFTVSRLLDYMPDKTAKFLIGSEDVDLSSLIVKGMKVRIDKMRQPDKESVVSVVRGVSDLERELKSRPVSDRMYEYFMKPPGKDLTNICRGTVDHFQVVNRTWGYHVNRAIIPFFIRSEVVGFCAIDIFGKVEWLKRHPTCSERDYKKVLFPVSGFKSSECLFGFDRAEKGKSVVLTEGPREVMKLWQEGITGGLALLGTRIHGRQLEMLGELAPSVVYVMFDGDDAGDSARDKVSSELSRNFKVRKCKTPSGKDPKCLDGGMLRFLMESSENI